MHADQIVPLAKGGTGDRSNYRWLCAGCHRKIILRN
ncbi:HNH endonuclease [Croceicoccus pelagius]